jgi:hypothetical protein
MKVRALKDCEHFGPHKTGSEFAYRGDPDSLPAWLEPATEEQEPEEPAPKEPQTLGELGGALAEEPDEELKEEHRPPKPRKARGR